MGENGKRGEGRVGGVVHKKTARRLSVCVDRQLWKQIQQRARGCLCRTLDNRKPLQGE